MAGSRDDFLPAVKERLAKRAGQRCSNPDCARATSGPHQDEDKVINVGVGAHITAASPGGPRYNQFITADDRSAITNGIWLCQKCAKLIDSDVKTYPEELLRQWKRRHEEAIKAEIEGKSDSVNNMLSPARLSIDAIFANPSADKKACILDIRVSNPGGSDLMIFAVQFQVLESFEKVLFGHAAYSAQYDIDIGKMRDYLSTGQCQVAQILKPGEADRFAIIMSDPDARPTIGGWRFATLFQTNVGNVSGPEIQVWLPHADGVPSFDVLTSLIATNAQAYAFIMGKELQVFTIRPPDVSTRGTSAYPSPSGGYETYISYGMALAFYHGPRPLWERGSATPTETENVLPEVNAAEVLYKNRDGDLLERTDQWFKSLAEYGDAKAIDNRKLVLEQLKLLIARDKSSPQHP